jgi:hypothetical protein
VAREIEGTSIHDDDDGSTGVKSFDRVRPRMATMA